MSSSEQNKMHFPFVLQGSCVPGKLKNEFWVFEQCSQQEHTKPVFCGLYVKLRKCPGSDHCKLDLKPLNDW